MKKASIYVATGLFAASMTPALAAGDSPWTLRLGISHIATESESSRTTAGDVRERSATEISANVNYHFTPNWALDVLLALPFSHDLELNGEEVGSTKHLPPTVSIKYHFRPGASIDPYIGAGLNYTVFFDDSIEGGDLDLAPSFGLAAMVGADYNWGTPWSVGIDVRYIDIDTEASVNGDVIGDVAIDPWVFSANLAYRF